MIEMNEKQLNYIVSLNYHDGDHPMVYEDVKYLKKLIDEVGVTEYFEMMYQLVEMLLENPVYEELSLLQMSVLVVYGENDRLIPNKLLHPFLTTKGIASDGAAQIKDSTLMTISKAGHMLQREKPQEFTLSIEQFLGRVTKHN
jgi:pimeloyl-ACP methyl ester carboxylesterase